MPKFVVFISQLFFICYIAKAQSTNTNGAEPATAYPYKINYSSQFEATDPEKGKTILLLWKDFEANNLDSWKNILADTVAMYYPTLKKRSVRDTIMARIKLYRDAYKTVIRSVDVIMSVKSIDKKGDFVLIWGKEDFTDYQDKKWSIDIHEVWAFNKKGKIVTIEQYTEKLMVRR